MLTNSHFALKPSQRTVLTTFFQKLSKLAKRPRKIATIKYPRYIFAKKCTLVSKKTPRICTPVQICQHEKMLTNSHFAVKPSQRTVLTTFFQKLSKLAKGQAKSRPSNTHNTFSQKNAPWFPRKHQEFVHLYKFVNMKKCWQIPTSLSSQANEQLWQLFFRSCQSSPRAKKNRDHQIPTIHFRKKNTLVSKKTPRICTPVQICQHEKMLTNSHFALKPGQRTALTTFFQKLSKLAQGPRKIATIKYPQCIFAKKCTLVSKKTPRICTPVQICQHKKCWQILTSPSSQANELLWQLFFRSCQSSPSAKQNRDHPIPTIHFRKKMHIGFQENTKNLHTSTNLSTWKNVDKFPLRPQAKPTNSFDNFFSEVVKARPGPSKIATIKYPRYIFAKKTHWFPRKHQEFVHQYKFVNKKNVDKFSLRRQAKPTNSFDNFFSEVVKARQGPSKIATIKYPQYIFAKKYTLVSKKTPKICTPVQICQHEKMLSYILISLVPWHVTISLQIRIEYCKNGASHLAW